MYDLLSVDPHMENHCVKPTTTPPRIELVKDTLENLNSKGQ